MSIAETILLQDQASGPAGKIASALGRVATQMDRVRVAAAGIRDIGPDLEKILGAAERVKVSGQIALTEARERAKSAGQIALQEAKDRSAASLQRAKAADSLAKEEAKNQGRLKAIAGANEGKAALQAEKLAAADQLAKNKAIAALILEQARGANQLAANENKAATQAERIASAAQKASTATAGGRASSTPSAVAGVGASPSPAVASAGTEELASQWSGILSTVSAVVTLMAAMGVAIGGISAAFIKASVSAAEFRTNTLAGLKAMLGTKEAAEDMYASIKKFAKESPFGKEEVAAGFKALLGAGFSKGQTEDILSGLFDVSALQGFSKEVIQRLTLTFSQIKAKGKLQMEEMLQLAEGSGGMVGIEKVQQEIATILGKTPADVAKMISAGAVKSDVAIKAILEVIRKNLSGGKLGALAKEMGAQSLQGLGSTIMDFFTDMFESVDISPLKKALASLVEVLTGGAGDKLIAAVTKLGNALFRGLFGGLDNGDQLTKIVDGIADAVNFVAEALEMAQPYLKSFGQGFVEGLGDVGGLLKSIFGGLTQNKEPLQVIVGLMKEAGRGIAYLIAGVAAFAAAVGAGFVFISSIVGTVLGAITTLYVTIVSTLKGFFTDGAPSIGAALVDGIVSGITSGISRVVDAITSMAASAVSAATSAFQIHSPSKVFAGLGVQLPAGAALGVAAGTPMLQRAIGSMASLGIASTAPLNDNAGGAIMAGTAAQAAAAGNSATNAGLPPVEINVNATVPAGANPQEYAQAVGDELRPLIRSEISRAMRRVA